MRRMKSILQRTRNVRHSTRRNKRKSRHNRPNKDRNPSHKSLQRRTRCRIPNVRQCIQVPNDKVSHPRPKGVQCREHRRSPFAQPDFRQLALALLNVVREVGQYRFIVFLDFLIYLFFVSIYTRRLSIRATRTFVNNRLTNDIIAEMPVARVTWALT